MRFFVHCAMKSKTMLTRQSAIGKWISTTCCACLASRTDLGSKGCISLHHKFGRHLGMNAAEVAVRAWLGEGVGELLIRIQHLRLEGLVIAHHCMRDVIVVG